MHHPEVYEQLSPELLQVLKQNITRLLDFSVQTYAYLLTTRTIDFKQKLKLIKIFHTIKKVIAIRRLLFKYQRKIKVEKLTQFYLVLI